MADEPIDTTDEERAWLERVTGKPCPTCGQRKRRLYVPPVGSSEWDTHPRIRAQEARMDGEDMMPTEGDAVGVAR